jgi:hypothetical protein
MKDGIDYKTADSRRFQKIAFLWNVTDRKPGFLLASKLSPYRDRHGAFQVFKEARNNAHGNYPEKVFVNSAGAYKHIRHANVKNWDPEIVAKSGIRKPHCE